MKRVSIVLFRTWTHIECGSVFSAGVRTRRERGSEQLAHNSRKDG